MQRSQISDWAKLRGVEVSEWFTDLDQSGGKLSRPGLDQAMQRIRDGRSDGIAVARLDRLSRAGVADALKLVEEIHSHDGQLAAIDLGIDPTTPFGEFALTIMLGLARMQRRNIADSWRESRRRAVERGVHVASRSPTGYRRGEGGRLEVVPASAAAVGEVFRQRASGASWGDLSAILEDAGVLTPYGAASWTNRSVSHLLTNRAYLGEARSGEFVNATAHEPIVDLPTWLAAQREPGTRAPRGTSLLGGIVRCAGCRYALKPDKMTNRQGERVRIYRCRGKRAGGVCPAPASVLGSVVEPWVVAKFFARHGTEGARGGEATSQVAEAGEAVVTARRRYAALLSVIDDELAETREEVARRAEAVRAAEADLAEAEARANVTGLPSVVELRGLWPELTLVERREILASAIHVVFLRSVARRNVPIAERAVIRWLGEGPGDLPGRGSRARPLASYDW